MTNIQLGYQNYLEGRRHNYATEDQARAELSEVSRHNRVYETETNRHNLATEGETYRHNVTTEGETYRHNFATEGIAREGNAIARERSAISRQAMLNQALLQRAQARLANSNAAYNEETLDSRVLQAKSNAFNDTVDYMVNRETIGNQLFDASWNNVRNVTGTLGDVVGSVAGTLARGLPSLAGTETSRQATRRRAAEVARGRRTTSW